MPTTLSLTYEQACLDLAAIVDERGEDYTYDPPDKGCVYFEFDDSSTFVDEQRWIPSCIVGCLIERESQALSLRIIHDDELNMGTNVSGLVDEGLIGTADPRTRILLYTAQVMQDGGRPYGEVLRYALIASEFADLIERLDGDLSRY